MESRHAKRKSKPKFDSAAYYREYYNKNREKHGHKARVKKTYVPTIKIKRIINKVKPERNISTQERSISIEKFKEMANWFIKNRETDEKPKFKIGTKVRAVMIGDIGKDYVKMVIALHTKEGEDMIGTVLTEEPIPLIDFGFGTYYVWQHKLRKVA